MQTNLNDVTTVIHQSWQGSSPYLHIGRDIKVLETNLNFWQLNSHPYQ